MSVGILLVTHDEIGASLIDSLQQMLGNLPLRIDALPVYHDSDLDQLREHLKQLYFNLNTGFGVLILTDLYGATPHRLANDVLSDHSVRIVSGLNFPMLVKLMNYPTTDLDTLAGKALLGGSQGIFDVNSLLNFT